MLQYTEGMKWCGGDAMMHHVTQPARDVHLHTISFLYTEGVSGVQGAKEVASSPFE